MIPVYGRIEKIWHNQRADGTEYWVLTIDGQRYSTWDPEHVAYVQEGEFVEFSFTNSGQYRNLLAIRRVDDPAPAAGARIQQQPGHLPRVRLACLRVAAALLGNTSGTPEQRVALAMSLAKRLEKYVLPIPSRGKAKLAKGRPVHREGIVQKEKEGGA